MADVWHIDYSATHLDGRTIMQARVGPNGEYATGAIRYIDDITNPRLVRTKHITKPEYQSLKANGVAMDAMYMEVGLDDPLGGYAGGQINARRALAGANYLGWSGKILFCCDRWLNAGGRTPIPVRTWQDYLDGAVSVLGRPIAGGYGFFDAMDVACGHVDFAVQAGSRSAVRSWVNGWQDNNAQPKVGGISTDRVLILKPFFAPAPTPGGGGSTPTPDPTTKPTIQQMEEYAMEPVIHQKTPVVDGQQVEKAWQVVPPCGGQLIVTPLDDQVCFFGNPDPEAPVYCWGPGGGKGGGHSTVPSNQWVDGTERRATWNNCQAYNIPKGTSRVSYQLSSNGRTAVQFVPNYLLG